MKTLLNRHVISRFLGLRIKFGVLGLLLTVALLDLMAGAQPAPIFQEPFRTETHAFPGPGYPKWQFIDVDQKGCTAFVSNGVLHIRGATDAPYSYGAAQIEARHVLNSSELPDHFIVTAHMGGGPGAAGQWSASLQIGGMQIGFYPGYASETARGHFFAWRIQGFGVITNGADMGFTPDADVLYPIRVTVRRVDPSAPQFEYHVTISDPHHPDQKFEYQFRDTLPDPIATESKIGFWRMDAPGGDALFRNLEIFLPANAQ